jgi:hypothetical protein
MIAQWHLKETRDRSWALPFSSQGRREKLAYGHAERASDGFQRGQGRIGFAEFDIGHQALPKIAGLSGKPFLGPIAVFAQPAHVVCERLPVRSRCAPCHR